MDSGLLCHLLRLDSKEDLIPSPSKGHVVETFAVAELMKDRMNMGKKPKLTYFRTVRGDLEVDAVADWRHTFAIEIKSSVDAETSAAAKARKYAAARET